MFIDIRPSIKGSSGGAKHSQGVDHAFLRSSGVKDMVDVGSKHLAGLRPPTGRQGAKFIPAYA